jgi:hypothetical protein
MLHIHAIDFPVQCRLHAVWEADIDARRAERQAQKQLALADPVRRADLARRRAWREWQIAALMHLFAKQDRDRAAAA